MHVVFEGSRRVGERDRSFLSASLGLARRNVARRMTGYRLWTRYTGHGATRGCIAHMQCPMHTYHYIYRDHLLLLLLPCPHAARRRIARPTPGSLLSIRSRCPRWDIFFLLRCSFFGMATLVMGGDVLAISSQIMTEQQGKDLGVLSIPAVNLAFFV